MRIAIPARGNQTAPALEDCDALFFFEDDHGRIIRREKTAVSGAEEALALLERRGPDVLVCAAVTGEEARRLAESGVFAVLDAEGEPEQAVLAYLRRAVVRDPNNSCNRCTV